MGKLRKRPATHIQVTSNEGVWLIEQKSNTLVAVPDFGLSDLLGRRVILDSGFIVIVDTTERITEFSRYRKVTMSA